MTIHARDDWSTACPDWQDRIRSGRAPIPDLPLFDEAADRALALFKSLHVPDLPGTPTFGEIGRQWMFDLVRVIFGSLDPKTKRRMIREYFVLVPKKNGKSSLSSAIIVVAAVLNERPNAELLLLAPTIGIAEGLYNQAKGIIELDADLKRLFWTRDHIREITHRVTGATIKIKAADPKVMTGVKAAYVFIDETHEFATMSKADRVFLEARGGLASRPEGFFLQITTQSKTPPSGIFKAELERARQVRDGVLRSQLLAMMYELPPEMQADSGWEDEETWPLVNPNLGASLDAVFLRDELAKAKATGPQALAMFASQHFNVEIGIGLGGWVGQRYWLNAADESITPEALIERCEVIVAGVDGGGLDDMLGVSIAGRCATTGDWLFCQRAWVHPEALEARKENEPQYRQFASEGHLVICEDPTQDVREVSELICRMNDEGLMPEKYAVGLDAVGVAAIKDALIAGGLSPEQLSAVGQGYRLSGHIKGVERKLKDGTLWHDGSSMMAWCAGNARATVRGSATLIEKQVAGTAKIDPLIALFNAFALLSHHPVAAGYRAPSPWDDPTFSLSGASA